MALPGKVEEGRVFDLLSIILGIWVARVESWKSSQQSRSGRTREASQSSSSLVLSPALIFTAEPRGLNQYSLIFFFQSREIIPLITLHLAG